MVEAGHTLGTPAAAKSPEGIFDLAKLYGIAPWLFRERQCVINGNMIDGELGAAELPPIRLSRSERRLRPLRGGQDVIAIGSRLRHLDLTFSDLALDNRGQPFVVLDRSRVQVVDVRPEPLLGLGILQLYGLLLVAYGGNQRNWDYAPRHRVAANRRPGPLSTLA